MLIIKAFHLLLTKRLNRRTHADVKILIINFGYVLVPDIATAISEMSKEVQEVWVPISYA
jgi:hypothetical protein